MFIAGLITYFFPQDLADWSGDHPFISMLMMLFAGIPMYVCATSSTPIAAALILKGLNPGAALVFLLAGPATNAATITIVKSLFNSRAVVIYLGMISICSLLMGSLLDLTYQVLEIDAQAAMGKAGQLFPFSVQLTGAVILGILLVANLILKFKNRGQNP